jgi:protein-S-isoprenylcysteine O-methyltransferase Ste14
MKIDTLILLFVILLEILLQIVWMITDFRPLREKISWSFRPQTLLFTFEAAASGVLLIIATLYFPLPLTIFDSILRIIGLAISVIGFIIAVWAKIVMKRSWGPAGLDHKYQEDILITKGPFSFSRNPIYAGIILLSLGTCIALRSYLVFLVLIPAVKFYKASIKEEYILEKKFGKVYLEYKNRVPRFLVK